MNAWPDVNSGAISRHLRQLCLRTSHTVRVYRGVLAGFQRLVEQRACSGTVDLAIVFRPAVAYRRRRIRPRRCRRVVVGA